ncbi:hypothetical protein TNCV_2295031 [Trichonephila clavipes]|nr:hypothetical protein TNCV_2295031 [Trichonephila clavipes]
MKLRYVNYCDSGEEVVELEIVAHSQGMVGITEDMGGNRAMLDLRKMMWRPQALKTMYMAYDWQKIRVSNITKASRLCLLYLDLFG